jgi:hypothetical protein
MPRQTMKGAVKAAQSTAAAGPIAAFQGGLKVPSGEDFTVEATLLHDTPVWQITLAGRTDAGQPFQRFVGRNQAHLLVTVTGVPDGNYQLVISVTIQDPGGTFDVRARSSVDEDRDLFVFVPKHPVQFDFRPVRVG